MFAIEREFGVKLREADMNFLTRLDFSSPTVMQDGFLTPETIAAIGPLIPALQQAAPGERITPGELFSLLTVETLCLMIERKLAERWRPSLRSGVPLKPKRLARSHIARNTSSSSIRP